MKLRAVIAFAAILIGGALYKFGMFERRNWVSGSCTQIVVDGKPPEDQFVLLKGRSPKAGDISDFFKKAAAQCDFYQCEGTKLFLHRGSKSPNISTFGVFTPCIHPCAVAIESGNRCYSSISTSNK